MPSQQTKKQRIETGLCLLIGVAAVLYYWTVLEQYSHQMGWDFPVFYIAAHLPVSSLYNADAFATFWQAHLQPVRVPHWAPYIRPSLFSLPLRPLRYLPYYPALIVWLLGGLAAYFASVLILIRRFQLSPFLVIACAAFFPAAGGIFSGADIAFYLLAFVTAFLYMERNRERWAGGAFALCLCKFHLTLLIPALLIFGKRYRALATFALGIVVVLLGSMSLTPLKAYTAAAIAAPGRVGGFPVGLLGFSNAIHQPWCYPALAVIVVLTACWLFRVLLPAESLSVALVGALLISPYIAWYDSTLLVLPAAVIYARSGFTVRASCVATLTAIPLWTHGGGNNGPIGFMHVGVELLMLGYFAQAGFTSRRSTAKQLAADAGALDARKHTAPAMCLEQAVRR